MKVKTNLRAGQGGATSTDSVDTSVDTSTSSQKQKGKASGGGSPPVVYYPPVSRCVGI
jgi:hypothetical protein